MTSITQYHLAVLWDWEFDKPFNNWLQYLCDQKNLSVLFVDPGNLEDIKTQHNNDQFKIKWILDRASESSPQFLSFIYSAIQNGSKLLNPLAKAQKASSNRVFQ